MSKTQKIFVINLKGRMLEMDVEYSMTVKQLKKKLSVIEGIPEVELRLIFAGRQLEDDRLLSDYGIRNEATIQLVIRQHPEAAEPESSAASHTQNQREMSKTQKISVRNSKGQMLEMDVEYSMTVKQLKEKLSVIEGTPEDQQRLIFRGKELMGGRLSDYGIQNHATIDLTLRLRGGGGPISQILVGGMGDKDGRHRSMERLSDFNTPSGSDFDPQ